MIDKLPTIYEIKHMPSVPHYFWIEHTSVEGESEAEVREKMLTLINYYVDHPDEKKPIWWMGAVEWGE